MKDLVTGAVVCLICLAAVSSKPLGSEFVSSAGVLSFSDVSTEIPPDVGGPDEGDSPVPLTRSGSMTPIPRAFTVNSIGDDGDDGDWDQACDTGSTIGGDAECTLRAAIQQANAMDLGDEIYIYFDIPANQASNGVWTIKPLTELTAISKNNVTIDASTVAGVSCGTLNTGGQHILTVVLDGQIPPISESGLQFEASADGAVVRGLVIHSFNKNGILSRADDFLAECMYIGTTRLGNEARPNGWSGVFLPEGANATVRNSLVSGNTLAGIWVDNAATNVSIEGNVIGVAAGSFDPLPNGYGIRDSGDHTVIGFGLGGGALASKSNVVAHNNGDGIRLFGSASAAILGNAIYANGDLGIDLNDDGVQANDYKDPDTGPNDLQNYPLIVRSIYLGGLYMNTTVLLNSIPDQRYGIEIFASNAPDITGYGEGQTPKAFTVLDTDLDGDAGRVVPVEMGSVQVGDWISATATRAGSIYESTSEFSAAVQVEGPNVWVKGKILLAGPYNGTSMTVSEAYKNFMYKRQPYDLTLYDGTYVEHDLLEAVDTFPPGVVDWVLISLRDGDTPGGIWARKAAFVTSDGTLRDLDHSDTIGLRVGLVKDSYWIQIGHRNHLSVVSAARVPVSDGIMEWDFTTAGKAYSQGGQPMAHLGGGKYGMYACDINSDGTVSGQDFVTYYQRTTGGVRGYTQADCNLDASVDALDANLYLASEAAGATSQVPVRP